MVVAAKEIEVYSFDSDGSCSGHTYYFGYTETEWMLLLV